MQTLLFFYCWISCHDEAISEPALCKPKRHPFKMPFLKIIPKPSDLKSAWSSQMLSLLREVTSNKIISPNAYITQSTNILSFDKSSISVMIHVKTSLINWHQRCIKAMNNTIWIMKHISHVKYRSKNHIDIFYWWFLIKIETPCSPAVEQFALTALNCHCY